MSQLSGTRALAVCAFTISKHRVDEASGLTWGPRGLRSPAGELWSGAGARRRLPRWVRPGADRDPGAPQEARRRGARDQAAGAASSVASAECRRQLGAI